MREIKFRAWDKVQSEMASNGGYTLVSIDPMRPTSLNNLIEDMPERYILMQYTGLKDKNRVEIFEGDIIYNGKYTNQVYFDHGAFCIKGVKNDDTFLKRIFVLDNVVAKYEVIGNIYEHGDLLK